VLRDGTLYGTLCCFSFAPNEDLTGRDLKRLQMAAQMMARLIDRAHERGLNDDDDACRRDSSSALAHASNRQTPLATDT